MTSGERGLSPRVRGNLGQGERLGPAHRSIPARAGEPPRAPHASADDTVYPRACGGTVCHHRRCSCGYGLSPRVRGNLGRGRDVTGFHGSIPARAGEPYYDGSSPIRTEVYPRACGGTSPGDRDVGERKGLSPRVRGNLAGQPERGDRDGSIPARAGEPKDQDRRAAYTEVYPRACGGTGLHMAEPAGVRGLSPRVRGNQLTDALRELTSGSIPARAGEPLGSFYPVNLCMSKSSDGGQNGTDDYCGDSPAMRRISRHTSRASVSARCRGPATVIDSTSHTIASEARNPRHCS